MKSNRPEWVGRDQTETTGGQIALHNKTALKMC